MSVIKETMKTHDNLREDKSATLGHYILGNPIGEGTFGKVRIATHIITEEKVAIKVLNKAKIETAADIERVAREIRILKIVRHPNVIQLYEIIETPKQLFLVTEYAAGGELFSHIVKNRRLSEREACRLFQQVISAVEYLHKIGVCHRDLKPENLLLDHSHNIKIVDFGLSNMYKPGEKLKTACGSPCYAAPEMIEGKKYLGIQTDIWSAGVVLFAMLAGYLPFEDQHTGTLYKKIMSGYYKMPKFFSVEAKDLIRALLNTDPNRRYTIDDIKKHPWYNLVPLKEPHGIVVGFNKIPVELSVVGRLEKFGFNAETVIRALEGNKHNHATTTYYLLLQKAHSKKFTQEIHLKASDITVPNFTTRTPVAEPKEQEPQKPIVKYVVPTPPPYSKPRRSPRTPYAAVFKLRREGARYTPAGPAPCTATQRGVSPTDIVNAYLKDRLNASIDTPLPTIPHTNQPTSKRMSMQERYREITTKINNIIGGTALTTPTNDTAHVTIFKPNIQNMTIISNGAKLSTIYPKVEHIKERPGSIDQKEKLNLSFATRRDVALKTVYKGTDNKRLNVSLEAPSGHQRLYRFFNPMIAKLPPALRQSIVRPKKP